MHKAEQAWAVESAAGQPVWLHLLMVEAVQAGPQVVTEGAASAGPDPIGPGYFEPAWTVWRSATVAPCQVALARKRLILAGAALPLDSAPGSALLFPLRSYFGGSVQRERRAAGSAARCLLQSAALQNLYVGSLHGCLAAVEPVLPGEREPAEQVEPPVVAAEPVPVVPARNSMYPRLLLPAVPGGIPSIRIRARSVAPGPVEPAKI